MVMRPAGRKTSEREAARAGQRMQLANSIIFASAARAAYRHTGQFANPTQTPTGQIGSSFLEIGQAFGSDGG